MSQCEKPCSAPPHPDLLARTKAQLLRAQRAGSNDAIRKASRVLYGEQGIPGLNDGTMYPSSYFAEPTSIMSISSSASARPPLRGAIRVIVVLVEFQDIKMAEGTKERMEDLWFSTDRKVPTGSVNEYYSEVSGGLISLAGEVVGPFTLSERLSYYSGYHSGRGWPSPNSQTIASEAFEAAASGTDFAQYDNDGNGYVDAFVVVHAGRAAEETGETRDLWSVKWTLPEPRDANGVKVFSFMSIAETVKCGVCAHEFGHLVFGWPDLFNAAFVASGAGNWCLMSFGSWGGGGDRPVHPSAWCKAKQGWIENIIENENRQVTLEDVKNGKNALRLWTNGDSNSSEYFLVENRQISGFDEYLPGSGLLIWHIDETVWQNIDESHPKIRLLQADGIGELKGNWGRGDAGDVYPGFAVVTNFSTVSNPSSKAYSGADSLVSITDIPASSPSMTFQVAIRRDSSLAPPALEPNTWYRLRNAGHQPDTHCLDVINDNGTDSKGHIEMRPEGRYSGQYWQIKSNNDGTYFLSTMFLGPNRRLDVYSHDSTHPVLQDTAYVTGQFWQIKPWGDGTWHLENAHSGQFRYLDVEDGDIAVKLMSADAARATQRWTMTPIREITEHGFL